MDTNHNKDDKSFKIPGNWNVQSKQLKEKFSTLTDYDLKLEEGKEKEMLERIGNRLRKNREEVLSIIKEINLS
jgi:phage anti-repressor protein